MIKLVKRIGPLIVACTIIVCTVLVASENPGIQNPFYSTPQWKLWHVDQAPVNTSQKQLIPTSIDKRLYPTDVKQEQQGEKFLHLTQGDGLNRQYAGMWDDVYTSLDKRHSYLPKLWQGGHDNSVPLQDQVMHFVYSPIDQDLRKFGVNFTSQSTTGMGHNLADSYEEIRNLERHFCFSNILRAGPAHISFSEHKKRYTVDKYDAITPCVFNSVGSSGSEMNGIAKMIIAGGHLPKKTKHRLKKHGLYIPTLLYIWKAALPYDVPYTNELRHRVAYASNGNFSDPYLPRQAELNNTYHRYDESQHLKNMITLAKSMLHPPPFALLQQDRIEGAVIESANKTMIRVHQKSRKTIKLRVSARDSFDLDHRPLSFHWTLLYPNSRASILPIGDGKDAIITIPFDAKLPKGRTVVMLSVNNGIYDSNPATINIYRTLGKKNLRPEISAPLEHTILAGEQVKFSVKSEDPEGLPTTLYRWANGVGKLNEAVFRWDTPRTEQTLNKTVSFITTDGVNGYNSQQTHITVTPTLAVVSANKLEGRAPLSIAFSSKGSKDLDGNKLSHYWDFDDGKSSTQANPEHKFVRPGFYEVKLSITGPYGTHTTTKVIHAKHQWSKLLYNGWWDSGLDKKVWQSTGAADIRTKRMDEANVSLFLTPAKGASKGAPISLKSTKKFKAPLYIETAFKRNNSRSDAGIEVLGILIGKLGKGDILDTSIGHLDANKQWRRQAIIQQLKHPETAATLRLYVTEDPNHEGKIRFNGWLETALGKAYFSYDNQQALSKHIRILNSTGNGAFEIEYFGLRSFIVPQY